MLKEHENPPMVYPTEGSITEFGGQWWVAHTKSRNEKALAHDLMAKDIHYFLPMTLSITRRTRRTVKSLLPVFTGYMFFCGDEGQRVEVLRTNRVANVLDVTDQSGFLQELTQIEKAVKAGSPLIPHEFVKKGQWCRVVAGPLMGLEGVVQDVRNITRLILQIDMLGQAACVEIDTDMVEVIEAPHRSNRDSVITP